jgi:hypothetical protein
MERNPLRRHRFMAVVLQVGQHLDAVALLVEVGVSMDQRCRTKRSRASGLVRRVVRK